MAKPKPAFVKSGLLIIVINIAVVIGSIILGATINIVDTKVYAAKARLEHGTTTSGDFESNLNEAKDGRIIINYKGKGGSIEIPATIDGLPVVGIAGLGRESEKITQITLPQNLKYLDHRAFAGSGITSITIPEGVTDIANFAFQSCANLTSVTLPQSLQRIGGGAFNNCASLTDVKIPSGKTIKYGSFVDSLIGDQQGTFIQEMKSYFLEDMKFAKEIFARCGKLSAASKQAIRDSGYEGDF